MLRLFVRPKRLQYSTFVEFMQLLVAFSTGPDEFYEQVQYLIDSCASILLYSRNDSSSLSSNGPCPDSSPLLVQVKPLAIRHMKYGVTAQNIKPFGTVLKNVLKRTLGDQYHEASQKAWNYVWTRSPAQLLCLGRSSYRFHRKPGEMQKYCLGKPGHRTSTSCFFF